MSMSSPTFITFVVYLLAMLAIGVYAWRKTHNLADYILGGRRLSAPVTALSAGASDMSGWLLLGLPGAVYLGGLKEGLIGFGLALGAYFNWLIIAPRLRHFTEVFGDALTLPDYFENRFQDQSNQLRLIAAIVILVFFTFYTASDLVAGATLFQNSFAMDYQLALWIGAGVIVSYTFIGGFIAVSWTDFFQGILMFLALIVTPVVVIYELGGLAQAIEVVAAKNLSDSSTISVAGANLADPFDGLTLIGFLSMMAWGFGYMGQPHLLARFMAIKSVSAVSLARRIAMTWMIFALIGSILTGFLGIAYFQSHPEAGLETLTVNGEAVFILLTQILFNPWFAGILLAAILAAVMSTIDSQLLVCSSVVTEDFYSRFLHPEASQKTLIRVGRISVMVLALIAIVIAADPGARVLSLGILCVGRPRLRVWAINYFISSVAGDD